MSDNKDGLSGLPERTRIRRLTLASWFNGGAAMLFLVLFIQQARRDCVPLSKWEESKNQTIDILSKQLREQTEQSVKTQAQKDVIPKVQEIKAAIDTMNKTIDSLSNRKL